MNGQGNIARSRIGPRTVLAPKEALTCQTCKDLEEAFRACLTHPKAEILLDLSNVPLMDSEALELLLGMHEELRRRGGALKVVGLNDLCRDILVATRLISVLPVYENVSEAIRSR